MGSVTARGKIRRISRYNKFLCHVIKKKSKVINRIEETKTLAIILWFSYNFLQNEHPINLLIKGLGITNSAAMSFKRNEK